MKFSELQRLHRMEGITVLSANERIEQLEARLRTITKERDALRTELPQQQEPVSWADAFGEPFRKKSEIDGVASPLYALPGAKTVLCVPDVVLAALDNLDDYIARIEGNDRGACNHINLLRRHLLGATVGENE